MKPLHDYVLVVETKAESTTASGIVLTGATDTGTVPGVVVAVGPEVAFVRAGDKVAVDWAKGLRVTHESQKAALVPQKAIYGVY